MAFSFGRRRNGGGHWNGRPAARRATRLSKGLGLLGMGLGLAQILAPGRLAGPLGMAGREGFVRLCGVRELASGLGLMRGRDRPFWLWARVAGDAMDVAALGAALYGAGRSRRPRGRILMALAGVAAVTFLDIRAARRIDSDRRDAPRRDYSRRSGFPRPPAEMRGRARDAFAAAGRAMGEVGLHPVRAVPRSALGRGGEGA